MDQMSPLMNPLSKTPTLLQSATENQRLAIETEGRALQVEAGAGTGKTWVLTQRYIHLLEAHPDWPIDCLVAVTFTEKAAREMRTRIRNEVETRAANAGKDSTWLGRRAELERMQVSTIHSLCARILRENAIPAGIDPLFNVLDEQQAGLLQEQAIEQTLKELSDTDSPSLELLAVLRVTDLRDLMAGLLAKRGTVLRLFENLESPDELLARWRLGLAEMRRNTWEAYQKDKPILNEAIHSLGSVHVLDPGDKLAPAVEQARLGILYLAFEELGRAFNEWAQIKRSGGKADNWGGKDTFRRMSEELKAVQEAGKAMAKAGCTQEIGLLDEQAAKFLHLWHDLWLRLEETYTCLKVNRQALDFDDLELLTQRLLGQQSRDPRLQAYLDGIYHLMVDEFQDTNPVQQSIVYALAHPAQCGKLFIVGDAKQSIYRFRQAQVTIFNRTGQDIRRATGQEPVRLDCSFRTHTTLVAALNNLFETILSPAGAAYTDYEAPSGPLEAQRHSPDTSSCAPAPVELVLLPKLDDQGDSIKAEEARLLEARWLAKRLLELQAEGYLVWDKGEKKERLFRFSDAAILFRSTTSLPVYEEQFKAAGLPYLTVSGRGYYLRPEIRDLTALLTALYSPGDDLNLAVALRSPLFSLSDETLYRLRWRLPDGGCAPEPLPYRVALHNPPANGQTESVTFASQVMAKLWSLSGKAEVWEILRTALDCTGFEAALTLDDVGRGGAGRKRSNVQKFMELARSQGGADLSRFLESLEDLRTREAREGEALGSAPESGAVQLMSIHAAKGLEFPVVAVADLGRRRTRPGETDRILFDPAFGLACQFLGEDGQWQTPAGYTWADWLNGQMEAAENKRLLYVACTRAADLLILSGMPDIKDTWMEDICRPWQIPGSGPSDELLEKEGFRLHVLRPSYSEPGSALTTSPVVASRIESAPLDLPELPRLARPLALQAEGNRAVTHQTGKPGRSRSTRTIHPAVQRCPAPSPEELCPPRAPAYLVGKLVHRILADWDSLALPDNALHLRMQAFARREGLIERQALDDALVRARRMVYHLTRSPLYKEINRSTRRLHEVPLTLETPAGALHGLIDLLYLDQGGTWHVLDWKTEWIKPEELEARAVEYAYQMADYVEAIRRMHHSTPVASICFLPGGVKIYTFTTEQLRLA